MFVLFSSLIIPNFGAIGKGYVREDFAVCRSGLSEGAGPAATGSRPGAHAGCTVAAAEAVSNLIENRTRRVQVPQLRRLPDQDPFNAG